MKISSVEAKTATNSDIAVCLGARALSKRYGRVQANRDVSISMAPGEIHAIVGENGAGKSTLMRMLQGIERPDSGSIIVNDQPVELAEPQQAFALGIGMVHQEFMLAPDLTLLENLVLGDEPVTTALGSLSAVDWYAALTSGSELSSQAGIDIDWSRKAGSTPVHIRQFVEIIRLLRRGAKILILDEPTAVLAPQQVEDLFDLLRTLRENGTTIIFISHKLKEVMALANRVTVMQRGEIRHSSLIDETDAEAIAGHMIGGDWVEAAKEIKDRSLSSGGDMPVFVVDNLNVPAVEKSHPLNGIDLEVQRGEIVGIAGVSGNGQNELVECLVGLRPAGNGSVMLEGNDITHLGNDGRRDLGLSYVSADRRQEGLALDASIEANVIAGSQRNVPICRRGVLDLKAMRNEAIVRLKSLDVVFGSLRSTTASLSGGNQQKLVFAREIATDPTLLIVSQPTRGVDLKGIAAIHETLLDFRVNGGSVLLVSEELDEILELSDRIYIIAGGRMVGQVAADEVDIKEIGRLMVMQGVAGG